MGAEVLIDRVVESTEGGIGEDQCGFRRDSKCQEQIFVLERLCKKMKEKERWLLQRLWTHK